MHNPGGSRRSTLPPSLDVDLNPSCIFHFRNRQRQHTIRQLGRHLARVDLRGQSDATGECRVSGRFALNRELVRLGLGWGGS